MDHSKNARPSDISIEEFDYPLPFERIAAHPLKERDSSKLLVYKDKRIIDTQYLQIANYLPEGSLMVFNQSKVIHARLIFKNSTGGAIEIFCLEPADKNIEINNALLKQQCVQWRCFVGKVQKWKEKEICLTLEHNHSTILLKASIIEKEIDSYIINFSWEPSTLTFAEILEIAGKVPLPPYIKREAIDEDKNRYQTTFAKQDGSVAAPTAGLHFTKNIEDTLREKKIDLEYITLHVGAGTFKPVKAETLGGHEMHSEQILVEKFFIEKLKNKLKTGVIAVGTTSLRTLESLYWIGLRISQELKDEDGTPVVHQWDPYTLDANISAEQSLDYILDYLKLKNEKVFLARTQLLIAPGYEWKIVNVLATNFHQPKSTLILLVSAFIGEDWKKIYNHALDHDYRFLSYGDGSLLFK
jgi:S-adenosylmethionine:tRNA ribosyltransferase-isomerase